MNKSNGSVVTMLEEEQAMLETRKQLLIKQKYSDLTKVGKAMVHLPDSDVKLIIPNELVQDLVSSVQFVISEDTTGQNATGVLAPFAGQLNVTYFTGE